jgi:hypothetical protein
MKKTSKIITLRCKGNDQIAKEVYRMRYDIYAKELSCSDDSINHSREICKDALDEIADIFLVKENNEIISSIRFVMLSDLIPRNNISHEMYSFLALSTFEPLFKDKTYVASRLAVKPTRRGSLAAIRLIENTYLEGLKVGVKFLLAYCEPSLIDMYLQLGLRIYGEALIDLDAHLTPLVLVMNDWCYLKEIKSPLYRAAQREGFSDVDDNSVTWFYQEFGGEIESRDAIFDIEQISKMLLIDAKVPVTDNHSPRIIDGLSENECNIVLSFCRIVKCRKDSILIKSGMVTYEMFIVIKGCISVYASNKSVKSFQIGPGEVFGETEMLLRVPRSEDYIVEEDSEVAILCRRVLDKVSKVQPVIANKLLLNIARTLSYRLYKSR